MPTMTNRFGNYRLGHLIDAVDDQRTYFGVHQQLKRETEVTLTKSSQSITARAAERYVAIARRIQPVVHPSFPKVYNAGIMDGTAFMTTERVAGEPLGSNHGSHHNDAVIAYQRMAQAMICVQRLFECGLTLHQFDPDDFRVDGAGVVRFARLAHLRLAGKQDSVHPIANITMWDWISSMRCDLSRSSGHLDSQTICVVKSLQRAQRSRSNPMRQVCSLLADAAENELSSSEPSARSTRPAADPQSIDFIRSHVETAASRLPRWKIVVAAAIVLVACGLFAVWASRPAEQQPPDASVLLGFEDSGDVPTPLDDTHYPDERSPGSILASIRPDRDCFDLECRLDGNALDIESDSKSGILQFPFTFPEAYKIAFRIHRLSGFGPVSIGCQAGSHRCLTVIDGTTSDGRWTGFHADDAMADQRAVRIASRDTMFSDGPLDVEISVTSDQIHLTCRNPTTGKIVQHGWTFDQYHVYSLPHGDAFYPCSLFMRFGKGVFRVGTVEFQADSRCTPIFSTSHSTRDRVAQLLWRGGRVDILSGGVEREVTTIGSITAPAEVRSLAKASQSPRLAIDDDGLDWISEFPHLRDLDLRSSDVTDGGLRKISEFSSLQFLVLDGDLQGMDGLANFSPPLGLRSLMLERFQINQDDADRFRRFADLTYLCLNGTKLDDDTVAAMVRSLPNLQHLCLKGTPISGTCLNQVASLGQLRELMLAQTGIDDVDLQRLTRLPRLEQIDLERTAVTPNGRAWLANRFPNLKFLP